MGNIGEPLRRIELEPLSVPESEPVEEPVVPEPVVVPEREPEQVPA